MAVTSISIDIDIQKMVYDELLETVEKRIWPTVDWLFCRERLERCFMPVPRLGRWFNGDICRPVPPLNLLSTRLHYKADR